MPHPLSAASAPGYGAVGRPEAKRLLLIALIAGLIAAGCGGEDDTSADGLQDRAPTEVATTAVGSDAATPALSGGQTSGSGSAATLTPIGPVAVNTFQIGDQTWTRTLPMTSGQCFLIEDPSTFVVAWGTLDENDDISFSVGVSQDGTFKAKVQSDVETDTWLRVAGPAGPGVDDLEIELDFDTLTITGEGTFTLFVFGDPQPGSFHFQCDPADQ